MPPHVPLPSDDLAGSWRDAPGDRYARWRGVGAFVDQGVVSLANFACTVLVARVAGKTDLGLYGLGFMSVVLLLGLAKALVWTPMTSLGPRLAPEERRRFDASVTVHFAWFAILAAIMLACLGAALAAARQDASLGRLFLVLAPASSMLLLREHVRRLCLARLEVGETLVFDVVVTVAQMAMLGVVLTATGVTALTATAAMAAGCLPAALWLAWRRDRFQWQRAEVWPDWLRTWEIGKWIAPNAAMVQVGNQTPRWCLEAWFGLREVGAFFSAQNVIQIANPILLGNSNYFGPRSAQAYADEGSAGLWRQAVQNTRMLGGLVAAVVLFAAVAGPQFIALVYGPEFVVGRELIVALALGMMSEVLLMPAEFSMLTLGRARVSFAANCARLLINLSLGLAMVYWLGGRGIGYGLLLGNAVALAWLWNALAAETQHGGRSTAPYGQWRVG